MTVTMHNVAEYWEVCRDSLSERDNGRITAQILNHKYPLSTATELLALTRASGVTPTEHELEGWEQFWIELGPDNQPEVRNTTDVGTAGAGWFQPTLPGLEEM